MKRENHIIGLLLCNLIVFISHASAANYRFVKSQAYITNDLSSLRSIFNLSLDYQFKKATSAPLIINSIKRQRFRELYRGVPIWNAVISARVNDKQHVSHAKGFILSGIEKDMMDTKPKIPTNEALTIAKKASHLLEKKN